MTTPASNFIEDKIPKYHPSNTKLGIDVSQNLVGMMQYAFGKDSEFYPIYRILLSITDGTTLLIIPGKIITDCKDNEMLVYSVYDNKNKMY